MVDLARQKHLELPRLSKATIGVLHSKLCKLLGSTLGTGPVQSLTARGWRPAQALLTCEKDRRTAGACPAATSSACPSARTELNTLALKRSQSHLSGDPLPCLCNMLYILGEEGNSLAHLQGPGLLKPAQPSQVGHGSIEPAAV